MTENSDNLPEQYSIIQFWVLPVFLTFNVDMTVFQNTQQPERSRVVTLLVCGAKIGRIIIQYYHAVNSCEYVGVTAKLRQRWYMTGIDLHDE